MERAKMSIYQLEGCKCERTIMVIYIEIEGTEEQET